MLLHWYSDKQVVGSFLHIQTNEKNKANWHDHCMYIYDAWEERWWSFRFVSIWEGVNTPNSVIIPPVMRLAGVTSNAGFQHVIPETRGVSWERGEQTGIYPHTEITCGVKNIFIMYTFWIQIIMYSCYAFLLKLRPSVLILLERERVFRIFGILYFNWNKDMFQQTLLFLSLSLPTCWS